MRKLWLFVVYRALEAVKQMELSQKHEAEETAALEKVMQRVEANLEATTVIFLCYSKCIQPSVSTVSITCTKPVMYMLLFVG